MKHIFFLAAGFACRLVGAAKYDLKIDSEAPFSFSISDRNDDVIVVNLAILAGSSNNTVEAVNKDSDTTSMSAEFLTDSVALVQVNSSLGFTGALFEAPEN